MKNLITILFVLSFLLPASAVELWGPGLAVVGSKAYSVTINNDDNGNELSRKIEQYDFPNLSFLTSLTVTKAEDYYISSVQAETSGLLVNQTNYGEAQYSDNDDGSVTVSYTDTINTSSYDTNLIKVGEKVFETSYSYISFPELLGADYNCPDTVAAKTAATKVLAKKKGGKHGGGKVACSKVKVTSHKVIK